MRARQQIRVVAARDEGWTGCGSVAARLLRSFIVTFGVTFAATALLAAAADAQDAGPAAGEEVRNLSLAEAIEVATRNNPAFLQRANDQAPANWQVREAWGGLLPSVTADGSAAYTEAGIQRIGTLDFGAQSTDWYSSNYSLNFNWQLDGRTLFGISSARANARSQAAGIRAEAFLLEQRVTLQYMVALRARDALRVAEDQFARAEENLEIVESRVATGAAAGTERIQAEVELGRAEVAVLTAERSYQAERLRLLEQMGVDMPGPVELASEFELIPPRWTARELIADAMALHPSLESRQATRSARKAQVRQEWSGYLPTVRFRTAFTGNALEALNEEFVVNNVQDQYAGRLQNCQTFNAIDAGLPGGIPNYQQQDCSQWIYTPSVGQAALADNAVFPFDFTRQPVSLSLSVSIPIFQGFSRQRRLEEAQAMESDAAHDLRAEELRIRTAITQSLGDVQAAYRSAEIEERNLELARQQLDEARQRYAVGAVSILDLRDAETSLSTAEQDYLDARYTFHQSLVMLEAATGRSLRPEPVRDGAADGDDGTPQS